MKIRSILIISFMRSQHSLPFKSRVFEIEQKTKIATSDVQVANHLSDVGFGKTRDYLRINDDSVIHDGGYRR